MVRDTGKLIATQLADLKKFLPTKEEKLGLQSYMKGVSRTESTKKSALENLSECERYMLEMLRVEGAAEKFDCLIFESNFADRVRDIAEKVDLLSKASDEIKKSNRLPKLLAYTLSLGNYINTGESKGSGGFTMDALLELDKVRLTDFEQEDR